ncbi:universal stress protein [Actinomadura sp. HBU206391]|uniref:universal stress protein n=1 Tax=Actinomadura sp. HBU206391 TaxID=2731692 RepID=UPI00164F483E|nr:universal stress protein [Actinomadura sp. HBU206391]MBC6463003.1 universal stress protein [Actinomadura sp. HBU206391]
MTNTIMVGVDGSDHSLHAVEWATEEAARRGCSLRLVYAVAPWLYDTPVDPRAGAVREWLLTGGEEILEKATAIAHERDAGVAVDGTVVPGPAAKSLLRQAEDCEMIVLAGRGANSVAGLLLGSVTFQVVSHSPVPAVIVRRPQPAVHREIVVGVDGSDTSCNAIGFAFEEAAMRKARLRAVRTWTHHTSAEPEDMRSLVHESATARKAEERLLAESLIGWREKFPDVHVIHDLVEGHAVQILSGASARADLIVVGTRGRGGFPALLLGSVSHALLHHAHCPLAVVPPAS